MTLDSYFLTTERLGFGRWREDDLDRAIGLWGDVAVTRLFDARGRLSSEQVRGRLFQEVANQQEWGVQYWPVFLLKDDRHVGACGLRPYDIRNHVFEIGFHLCSDQWGRGLATEAARAVIRYAFVEIKANGLFAGHHPKNVVSRHLLEKLGFHYTRDEYYEPTGLQHPSYLLGREDFKSLPV